MSKRLNASSKFCLPSDRPIILVFHHQGSLQKSGASPPTGAQNTRGLAIFDQYAAISRKRCIRSTPCLVLGYGFRGQRIEWRARPICGSIKSKMVAGGHLGMMALSRVTVASAGLSCSRMQAASMLLWSGRPYKQASISGLTPLHSPRNTKARFLRL